MLSRRSFFGGLAASFAAPAIVRAASLMPVRSFDMPITIDGVEFEFDVCGAHKSGYQGLMAVTRKALVPRLFVQLYAQSRLGVDRAGWVVD